MFLLDRITGVFLPGSCLQKQSRVECGKKSKQMCSDIFLEHPPRVQHFAVALGLPGPELFPVHSLVLKRETAFF